MSSGFGKRMAWVRKKKDLTQEMLAEILGTSSGMISAYENGKVIPSAARLQAMADIFGVSMDALWRGKRKKE